MSIPEDLIFLEDVDLAFVGEDMTKSIKTLDKISSSGLGSQEKVVDLNEIYNFPLGIYLSRSSFV